MRTVTQVAGIGLATAVGSVTIALLQAPAVPDQPDWAATGLAQLDVAAIACDPTLPDGPRPEAIQERLRTVTPSFMPCLAQTAPPPHETLRLELTVDCTGRLAEVAVVEAGDWPSDVVACTRSALGRARFPAHGLKSGYTFDFPVRYTGD